VKALLFAPFRRTLDPGEVDLLLCIYLKSYVLLDIALTKQEAATPVAGRFLAALISASTAAHQQQRDDKASEQKLGRHVTNGKSNRHMSSR
jgi:hypothetical protein